MANKRSFEGALFRRYISIDYSGCGLPNEGKTGRRVFFWPFDGWAPSATKHVIAEVYPALFKNRYRASGLTRGTRI